MKDLFLDIVCLISELVGHIRVPWSRKALNGTHYFQIHDMIEPGDILLSTTHGELSSLFIPGLWNHAGIVTVSGVVTEAVGKGVKQTDLVSFVTSKDRIAVLRPKKPASIREKAALKSLDYIGLPYDKKFQLETSAMYCSELVHTSYMKVGHQLFKPRMRMGYPVITAQDIWDQRYGICDEVLVF